MNDFKNIFFELIYVCFYNMVLGLDFLLLFVSLIVVMIFKKCLSFVIFERKILIMLMCFIELKWIC